MKTNKKYGWYRSHEINEYPIVMEPITPEPDIIPDGYLTMPETEEIITEDTVC